MEKQPYLLIIGLRGYLPDDVQEYATLNDVKQAASDTIEDHICDLYDSGYYDFPSSYIDLWTPLPALTDDDLWLPVTVAVIGDTCYQIGLSND